MISWLVSSHKIFSRSVLGYTTLSVGMKSRIRFSKIIRWAFLTKYISHLVRYMGRQIIRLIKSCTDERLKGASLSAALSPHTPPLIDVLERIPNSELVWTISRTNSNYSTLRLSGTFEAWLFSRKVSEKSIHFKGWFKCKVHSLFSQLILGTWTDIPRECLGLYFHINNTTVLKGTHRYVFRTPPPNSYSMHHGANHTVNTGVSMSLKKHLLFVWNVNLTGCFAFSLKTLMTMQFPDI